MDNFKCQQLNNINFHWFAIVFAGMYTHLRQICIIGLCLEDDTPPPDPSYGSVLFIFSVLCLLAEYELWPPSLKKPPSQVLYIFEMMVAALVVNLATRAIWTPVIQGLYCLTQEASKFILMVNSMAGLDKSSPLILISEYLSTDCSGTHLTMILAVLCFVWMLDATESLDFVMEMISK